MDTFKDAHHYTLPSQGNVYTYVNLSLTNGSNKVLFGILKRKVLCCEFITTEGDHLVPVVKEIPFTYIPAGAEIISMDAFNRSPDRDHFFIGISIVKVSAEQTKETYLNVYTEQDSEEKDTLNLESMAQNCLMLELNFTPYQLFHTYIINEVDYSKEVVWLLSGSDLKVHLFREDPLNHTYCESEVDVAFPEFNALVSVILWMDITYTEDLKQRFTAYGCECGLMKLMMVDSFTSRVLRDFSDYYDAPVSCVRLFSFSKILETKNIESFAGLDGAQTLRVGEDERIPLHLLVVNTLRASAVFMYVHCNEAFKEGRLTECVEPNSIKIGSKINEIIKLETLVNMTPFSDRGCAKDRNTTSMTILASEENPASDKAVCKMVAVQWQGNIAENGLNAKSTLPDSEKYDAAISSCLADIDMDGKPEVIIGTYSQMMLAYKYDEAKWKFIGKRRCSHAVHAIGYTDLSSDGVKELIIATMSGIHILQHKPVNVLKVFYERLIPFLETQNSLKEPGASGSR